MKILRNLRISMIMRIYIRIHSKTKQMCPGSSNYAITGVAPTVTTPSSRKKKAVLRGKKFKRYLYSKRHDQVGEPPSVYFKGLQDRPPSRIVTDFTYHGNHQDVRHTFGNRLRFHTSAREVMGPKGRISRRWHLLHNSGTTPARRLSTRPWRGDLKRMALPRPQTHLEIVVS
jgi:hypothetical protein